MEKTRNSIQNLFKNFGLAINKLINSGEIDDVELTGELAKDPIEALKEHEASVKSAERTAVQAKARTRIKTQTREGSTTPRSTRTTARKAPEPPIKTIDDDGRDM